MDEEKACFAGLIILAIYCWKTYKDDNFVSSLFAGSWRLHQSVDGESVRRQGVQSTSVHKQQRVI